MRKTIGIGVLTAVSTMLGLVPFLSTNVEQAEAQPTPRCYVIRSLNRNFQTDIRYLGGVAISSGTQSSSDGSASVQEYRTRGGPGLTSTRKIWVVTPTDQGSILTVIDVYNRLNLDGASDGRTAKFLSPNNVTHGQYWQIEQDGNGYRIRSLNNNFRNQNYRWLDGASDGRTVQLVNGKSHGTLWEFTSTKCP